MKKLVGLSICMLLAAGVAAAHGLPYEPIDSAELAAHPETYHGRQVEITASIIAINADGNSLKLFDRRSRTMVTVRLTLLERSERSAMINSPALNLLVQGRATVIGGRLVIDADKAEVLPPASDDSGRQAPEAASISGLSSALPF